MARDTEYLMAKLFSHFDLLTTEEIEEWARLRDSRYLPGEFLWKDISAEVNFIHRMRAKYKYPFPFPTTYGSIDGNAYVDEYIKGRRRSDKVGVILDNHPKE